MNSNEHETRVSKHMFISLVAYRRMGTFIFTLIFKNNPRLRDSYVISLKYKV